ncbi:MAG TPA: signal peptide peptidase SppA [Tepidisphaeraceae bacterium]|nr:signal peptide peptidase SppA [Tepidisphaeraceae bacterium]
MMPPPGMMPPPMFMMPPPPKRERGFARGIFLTLAMTVFGLSLSLNVYLLVASGLLSGGSSRLTNVIEGDPTQKVAVLPINGAIFDDTAIRFSRWISQVEKDDAVKALVIEVDSPGGSVTASDEIWHRLRQFKADHPNMPVVVAQSGLAASGGYYVSCAGDYIIAQPSTLTGNIGVLLPQYNVSQLFDKWGIKETTITSTGATFKNAGSMFQPERAEDRAYLQDIADKAFAQFKDVVAQGRQGKLRKPLEEVANGKIFTATDAKALGLIDDIGYKHDAYQYAATKAGLDKRKITVVKYQDPPSFFGIVTGKSNVGAAGAESSGVNVGGVNIDASAVRELTAPRLLYLWRGH